MKKLAKNILKKYLFEKLVERDYSFEVKENYKFVISYPKSGNTWMRFLLANVLSDEEIDFVNIEDKVIDIYKRNNKEIEENDEHLDIFKSHSYFRPKFSNNKVVYIVRDPRDVVISYYHYFNKTKDNKIEFNQFLKMFLKGDFNKFGSWRDNVGSWLGAKQNSDNFLLIKYEDLLEDTYREFVKVCEFLNIKFDSKSIKIAIENSSFNNLKKIEEEVENEAEETKNTDKNKKFFRKGKSQEWKDFLTESQVKEIENKFGNIMIDLNYDLKLIKQ